MNVFGYISTVGEYIPTAAVAQIENFNEQSTMKDRWGYLPKKIFCCYVALLERV